MKVISQDYQTSNNYNDYRGNANSYERMAPPHDYQNNYQNYNQNNYYDPRGGPYYEPPRNQQVRQHDRVSTPMLLMVAGVFHLIGGIILCIMGLLGFPFLVLAGVASFVVGTGFIKGWSQAWYVGIGLGLALACVAGYVAYIGFSLSVFGLPFTILGGLGLLFNLGSVGYLFIPGVKRYFGM